MTGNDTIIHINLNAGSTLEEKDRAASAAIDELFHPVIEQALQGQVAALPGIDEDFTLTGGRNGHCFAATVCGPRPTQAPIASVAIVLEPDDCGRRAWDHLHTMADDVVSEHDQVATNADHPPPVPWCATLFWTTDAHWHWQYGEWLGEVEQRLNRTLEVIIELGRALAWTWRGMLSEGL